MKKNILKYLIFIVMILPIYLNAETVDETLNTFNQSINKANNYIKTFSDRNKYLIFNKNYIYDINGFGSGTSYKTGGMISRGEFNLSSINDRSYLANGKEYWTLSILQGGRAYYIDEYLGTKSQSTTSGTRVTQFIKSSTFVSGNGTINNPWEFSKGHLVRIIPNNSNYGSISPSGEMYVSDGESITFTITPQNGYRYNPTADDCNLIDRENNQYELRNIHSDVTCTIVFETISNAGRT